MQITELRGMNARLERQIDPDVEKFMREMYEKDVRRTVLLHPIRPSKSTKIEYLEIGIPVRQHSEGDGGVVDSYKLIKQENKSFDGFSGIAAFISSAVIIFA